MNEMLDAHWFHLESQGNIYSMTSLLSCTENDKILAASLKRKIYSCEYSVLNKHRLKSIVKELLFTYLPSGAEIISLDAYNNSKANVDEFVIGVTIIKPSGDNAVERYLNVYTEVAGEGEVSPSLEVIGQNCLMLELDYHPFHLYHTILPNATDCEIVWMISGSDTRIHLIREDKLNHSYKEYSLERFFPELERFYSIALWINIYYYNNNKQRITSVGCDNGVVIVALVDVEKVQIDKFWKLQYDDPVCSIRIFAMENTIKVPSFLEIEDDNSEDEVFNIVVLTTTTVIIFKDILKNGLECDEIIANDGSDCYSCSCIMDINMDGRNELLIGTYGEKLLVYAEVEAKWQLIDSKIFDSPIYSICSLDMTGDGVNELAVMTQRGIHILQHDPDKIAEIWKERFESALNVLLKD